MMHANSNRRRILVVDDNTAVHEDFRKILVDELKPRGCDELEAELFGASPASADAPPIEIEFLLDYAAQGEQAVEKIESSANGQSEPYMVAFVDVRMPPGWDGIETISRIWKIDPRVQAVLCTAFSDRSWQEIIRDLGVTDRLLILKKPFDAIEVRQLALTLTTKWIMAQNAEATMQELLNRLMLATDAAAA